MASCDYCGSTILFGGKYNGNLRFCSDRCNELGSLMILSQQVPPDLVAQRLRQIHQSACPECGGPGPVDVHTSHRVWSALVLTSWSSRPTVCCRKCGLKNQAGDLLISLFLGWWGFPWGLVMTPVQIIRNIVGMASGPDPVKPSSQLEKIARLAVGNDLRSGVSLTGAKPPPLPSSQPPSLPPPLPSDQPPVLPPRSG